MAGFWSGRSTELLGFVDAWFLSGFGFGGGLRPEFEQRYYAGMSQPDFQPTLTGPTVIARPLAAADWPELFSAGSDPEIWKVHPRSNRYTEPEFREYFDSAVTSKMAFVFVDRATQRNQC